MSDEPPQDAWPEVLYLLVERYGMPDAAEVAARFRRHLEEHGEEVPGVAAIRNHVDDEGDFPVLVTSDHGEAEIRAYFREILRHYDAARG